MMTRAFVLTAAFWAAGMASASAETVECRFTDLVKGGGWVPQSVSLTYDRAAKSVKVEPMKGFDGVKLTRARVIADNNRKLVVGWRLLGTRDKVGQRTDGFDYRLSIRRGSGKATAIAKPLGYPNDFRASGTCRIS